MCLPLMKAFLQELATGVATSRSDANAKNQLTDGVFRKVFMALVSIWILWIFELVLEEYISHSGLVVHLCWRGGIMLTTRWRHIHQRVGFTTLEESLHPISVCSSLDVGLS